MGTLGMWSAGSWTKLARSPEKLLGEAAWDPAGPGKVCWSQSVCAGEGPRTEEEQGLGGGAGVPSGSSGGAPQLEVEVDLLGVCVPYGYYCVCRSWALSTG